MTLNEPTEKKPAHTGRGINGSTKNSGNSNLVSGSSITGKNPFAILKASAIATPTSAVFPNNF